MSNRKIKRSNSFRKESSSKRVLLAAHPITQHRDVGKSASKKIHAKLHSLDKFFKVAGLGKDSFKTKVVSFKATLIQTRDFRFDREEANA
jgi:hypothetical protein